MATYKSFTHVEKLGTADTDGILNGTCYISAKVDGTNAVVWCENGKLQAGSRTRELSESKDNAGFYAWVNSADPQVVALDQFCKEHPQYMIYGEWLGQSKFVGHIKDYNSDALGHLWVFDVYDQEHGAYLSDAEWRTMFAKYPELNKYVVALLAVLDTPTMDEVIALTDKNFFLLDNANHPGEGVVIKNANFINMYGRPCYGKIVRDDYRQDKAKKQHVIIAGENEQNIVAEYVTEGEMAKAKEKTAAYFGTDEFYSHQGKYVGFYLNLVYNDCILEECKNWTKKFKVDTVSFMMLKRLTLEKARNYIGL